MKAKELFNLLSKRTKRDVIFENLDFLSFNDKAETQEEMMERNVMGVEVSNNNLHIQVSKLTPTEYDIRMIERDIRWQEEEIKECEKRKEELKEELSIILRSAKHEH